MLTLALRDEALEATGHSGLLLAGLWSCNILDSTAFASLHVQSECFKYVPLLVRKPFLASMQSKIDAGMFEVSLNI